MSKLFSNSSDRFEDIRDTASDIVEKVGSDAHKAWKKSSQEERVGVLGGIALVAVLGIGVLIWRALRDSEPHYVEIPRNRER